MSTSFSKKLAALQWPRQGEDSDSDDLTHMRRSALDQLSTVNASRKSQAAPLAPLTVHLGPEINRGDSDMPCGLGYLMDRRPSVQLTQNSELDNIRRYGHDDPREERRSNSRSGSQGGSRNGSTSPLSMSHGGNTFNQGMQLSLAPLAISPEHTPSLNASRDHSPEMAYPPSKKDFRESVNLKSLNLSSNLNGFDFSSGAGENGRKFPMGNPFKRVRTPRSARSPFEANSFGFPNKKEDKEDLWSPRSAPGKQSSLESRFKFTFPSNDVNSSSRSSPRGRQSNPRMCRSWHGTPRGNSSRVQQSPWTKSTRDPGAAGPFSAFGSRNQARRRDDSTLSSAPWRLSPQRQPAQNDYSNIRRPMSARVYRTTVPTGPTHLQAEKNSNEFKGFVDEIRHLRKSNKELNEREKAHNEYKAHARKEILALRILLKEASYNNNNNHPTFASNGSKGSTNSPKTMSSLSPREYDGMSESEDNGKPDNVDMDSPKDQKILDTIKRRLDVVPRLPHQKRFGDKGGDKSSLLGAVEDVAAIAEMVFCGICMERQRSHIFEPCYHFLACGNCAKEASTCPICATGVKSLRQIKL